MQNEPKRRYVRAGTGDPFAEGYDAAVNRQPQDTNPYPEDDENHQQWIRGWKEYTGAYV